MKQSITLDQGETWKLSSETRSPVTVQSGAVWVTYEGNIQDFVFHAGESITLGQGHRKPIVGALTHGATLVLGSDKGRSVA